VMNATSTAAGISKSMSLYDSFHVSPSRGIRQSVNDRAIDLFLSTHVLRDSTVVRGYFEYLFTFYSKRKMEDQLSTSICAVALAAYGNTVRSPALLREARQYLGRSLRLVNTALSSRQGAIKDSTVISIMLLSTFETITCKGQRSLMDCDAHIKGATCLITLRGCQQFQCRVGQQVFLQMCSNILLGCLQRSVYVPVDIIKHRVYAANFFDTDDPAWQLSDIIVAFATFRADVKHRILSDHCSVIAAALRIDTEFSLLATNMPVQWQFETVFTDENPELVFGSCYHVYPDLWVAHIWNTLRTCRLLLYEEICTRLRGKLSLPSLCSSSAELQYHLAIEALKQITLDICATIPQYSGHLSMLPNAPVRAGRTDLSQRQRPPIGPSNENISPTAGTYFLLWPLLNAGQMAASDNQRVWIINRLRYIGSMTGIQQAFALADVLERREKIYCWD
jgi:hypothetical protein